jgi:hypothetical protein
MQFDTMLAYNELLASRPWTADHAAIAKGPRTARHRGDSSARALAVHGQGACYQSKCTATRPTAWFLQDPTCGCRKE